jgi:iron complex transport system substrate-binding protein
MRLVSLVCSNTEIVCALGCAHWLVGVDDHSDRPTEIVARLPRVGPDLQIDVERVAALKPDLVLASLTVPGHEKVVQALEDAGLPHLVLAPKRLEDVYTSIATLARHLGVAAQGEALVSELRATMVQVQPLRQRPRLLVQWWNRPTIAPGGASWVSDLIALAGGENPLAGESVASRPLTDEEVAALKPDAFVLSWCGVAPQKVRPDVIYRNPVWQHLAALEAKRVYCVPEAHLGRPGPGLVRGYFALASIVRSLSDA